MTHCFDRTQSRQNGPRARVGSALMVPCYVAQREIRPSGEKRIGCPAEPETGLSPSQLRNFEIKTKRRFNSVGTEQQVARSAGEIFHWPLSYRTLTGTFRLFKDVAIQKRIF